MTTKHKHYDCIIAWAEGKQIEYYASGVDKWFFVQSPNWIESIQYRIKPEEKKKIKMWLVLIQNYSGQYFSSSMYYTSIEQAEKDYKNFYKPIKLLLHTEIEVEE